jgi:5-methyltetrahydropteroyltriglutamate--homocysteine methyltransferase
VIARQGLPDGVLFLPGVIDTTTNYVEHPEVVADRLERFANVVGRERVVASTDSGFAPFAGDRMVDPKVAFAKLESLVRGAEIATRRLWTR